MIRLQDVWKRYGEGEEAVWAVRGLDLHVAPGELLVLLGASGCGKTTTLKMINRLVEPTRGEVFVEGRSVLRQDPVALRRSIGYVFQGIGLFPHLTVAGNVAVVPRLLGWEEPAVRQRVEELLELVGLEPARYGQRRPSELSGGQQQRVGVARALAGRPRILLMDEPFGALDPLTRDELRREYRALHERLGITTVMVSHDVQEALLLADRIGVMAEGRLLQLASSRQLLRGPEHPYVEQLMRTPREQTERLEALLGG